MTPGTQVVVVGAGPAGLAAAVAAADAGAHVALLDGEARPGGQYWRNDAAGAVPRDHDPRGWQALSAALASHEAAGRIDRRSRHRVWRLDAGPDRATVHAVAVAPDGAERPVTVTAQAVVVATGAHDRVLPFPGWDLPGVLTPGAVQALLTEHGVAAGSHVVLGGTGPFLLPVATALLHAGARIEALVEAGNGRGWLTGLPSAVARLPEAARYAAVLAGHGVRPRLRHAVVAAHGTDRVEAVTVARVDATGVVRPGTARRVECDAVAVGWGFTARTELALQAGAVAVTGPDGGTAVAADVSGRTAVPGVLVAGELLGIAGAPHALVTGRLAGAAAAGHAVAGAVPAPRPDLLATRRRLVAFAEVLHRAHPVPPAWPTWLDDATLVCRCEEVPLSALHAAVDHLGATDARTAKLLTRCGMGWCQGRMCGEAVTALVAARSGRPAAPDRSPRPVAVPITLAALAGEPTLPEVPDE